MKSTKTVYILCASDANPERVVAGLTVGERLLLALSYGGVEEAVLIGPGKRPKSDRATIAISEFQPAKLADNDEILIMPSDLVFDRGLLKDPLALPPDLPLQFIDGTRMQEALSDVDTLVSQLPPGHGDFGHGYAIRAVDQSSAARARKALFLSLIKPIDGVISRHINRKFSLAVTRILIHTPISPNALTFAIMILGILSGVAAFFAEHWWALLLAGVLFQTQSMLDGCDGEIARLRYQFSKKGQWLDSIGDDVTNYIFCLGCAFGQARVHGWDWLYWFGIVVFAVQWFASILMYQRIYKMNTGDLLAIPNMVSSGEPKGRLGSLVRIIHLLTKRDFFVFVTSILAAIQLPLVAFALIAAGSFVMAPSLTVNELRIRRAIRAGELHIPL